MSARRRAAIRVAVQLAMVGAALGLVFGAAGTLAWPRGWAWLAAVGLGLRLHRAHVARRNPELLVRRQRLGPGTPRWDLVWNALFWPILLSAPVAAALETVRLARPAWPAWTFAPGALLLGAGLGLSARAMAVNRFFEGSVRLQPELGQRPVDAGPYARLRHPGYLGLGLAALSQPLLLGSGWAGPCALATVAWIAWRTAREDRFLQAGLAGYADYARRVRHRLLPGLW